MAAIGELHLQALFRLRHGAALLVNRFLCRRVSLLDQRQALLLRSQPHFALLGTLVRQCREFLPACLIGVVLLDIRFPLDFVGFELREDVLEDGIAFLGVAQFPARVKCALLGWSAWKDAVAHALAHKEEKND